MPPQYLHQCKLGKQGRVEDHGHFRAAAFLLFSAGFRPLLGSCIFIFSRPFLAIFRQLHCSYFRPLWPFSAGCIFIIFSLFGHFQAAAFLVFSGVLTPFRQLHFHYFPPFWPFSDGCIFIIFGRFGHFRAAFLLFSAGLDIFGRLHFILFGYFGHFRAAEFLLSSAGFRPFSGGRIFIIFGCFGHFWAASFLSFLAVLTIFFCGAALLLVSAVWAIFGRLHFYYVWPFGPFSRGPHFY